MPIAKQGAAHKDRVVNYERNEMSKIPNLDYLSNTVIWLTRKDTEVILSLCFQWSYEFKISISFLRHNLASPRSRVDSSRISFLHSFISASQQVFRFGFSLNPSNRSFIEVRVPVPQIDP
ncbi:hypothetical protein SLE2022_217640 [Rubroshorea leprosula]